MTKILIVDDSALMRKLLKGFFEEAGGLQVEVARNGVEAIEKNLSFEPDLITLDINMPEMDGITALSHIMSQRPVPVIMVSSLTEKGALATFEALNLGAVDYVTKPGGTISLNIEEIKDELLQKVKTALKARFRQRMVSKPQRAVSKPSPKSQGTDRECLVIIGVSTGGPRTLEEILPELPSDFPMPVVVAQHMPPTFTKSFSERLNTLCNLNVLEVSQPLPLEVGNIYIGKGGGDVLVTRRLGRLMVIARPEDKSFLWHPSVELLGRSVLDHLNPSRVIAVMLTGMGYDGAEAFTALKNKGARTIAESEETAVVFGMPRELIERGGATLVLPADKIARQVLSWSREIVKEDK